ncbi:MAG: class I SAM-dependent methyltransferase [Planctomycetota bacterium]
MSFPRRELRRAYDRDAGAYDARFRALQAPKLAAVLARYRPARGARVGDLGCGTGLLLEALEEGGPLDPQPLLLDLSAGMLSRVPAGRARRVQGDLTRLPLRDGCLDAAFAITSLLGARGEVLAALLEVRRVLVPGGTLALTLLASELWAGVEADLAACGLRPGAPFACGQDRGWICARA